MKLDLWQGTYCPAGGIGGGKKKRGQMNDNKKRESGTFRLNPLCAQSNLGIPQEN